MFLVHLRGAEPSPIHSLRRGKPLVVAICTFKTNAPLDTETNVVLSRAVNPTLDKRL